MEKYENGKNFPDSFDILLGAAAENAGKPDIDSYLGENKKADFSPQFVRRMKKIISGEKTKQVTKKVRTRTFGRQLLAACLCALLVCALTVMGIAGIKRDSAQPIVDKSKDNLVIVYDMNGISGREQKISQYKAPTLGKCHEISKTETEYVLSLNFAGGEYTYTQRRLTKDYTADIGSPDSLYFELLVKGKYSGIAAVSEENGKRRAVLAWNDGKYAYTLCGDGGIEVLAALAESIYTEN